MKGKRKPATKKESMAHERKEKSKGKNEKGKKDCY
jgi:hypothetical protein